MCHRCEDRRKRKDCGKKYRKDCKKCETCPYTKNVESMMKNWGYNNDCQKYAIEIMCNTEKLMRCMWTSVYGNNPLLSNMGY
jgi:hypothetical protein